MARIKRETSKSLLVGYRPRPGEEEVYWSCPSREVFDKFCKYEAACKAAGAAVDHNSMAGSSASARSTKSRPTPAKPKASTEPSKPKARQKASVPEPTLREWVGDPKEDNPGPFFDHVGPMSKKQRIQYQACVRLRAPAFADKRMSEVGFDDSRELLRRLLVCPACFDRARRAGEPTDHLLRYSVAEPAWDGECFDDEGEPNHYPRLQRGTIQRAFTLLGAAWGAAISAKEEGKPELQAIVRNPFKGIKLPRFADRPDNNDRVQALNHGQLDRLEAAMPDWLAAFIGVAIDGMFRRSEVIPLNRGALQLIDGRYVVTAKAFAVERGKQVTVESTGKNDTSTNKIVYLTQSTSDKLRLHLETYCSTPNPARCAACRAGKREHEGPAKTNPHRQCDFASSSFVWRSPDGRRNPHPATISKILKQAAIAAGLTEETLGFVVTFKILRSTGATLMLEAGIAPDLVQRQGGWKDIDTMFSFYNRTRSETMRNAVDIFERSRRLALHQEVADITTTERLASLTLALDELKAENAMLRRALDIEDGTLLHEPQRIKACEPRRTKFTDEAMRAAVAAGGSRLQMLRSIGVAVSQKNYQRFEKRAAELGLAIPDLWTPPTTQTA